MKTAESERENPENHRSAATELPALLVAGGSCSRLCRPPRASEDVVSVLNTPLAASPAIVLARASARP